MKIIAVGDCCLGDHYFSLGHGSCSRFGSGKSKSICPETHKLVKLADIAFCNVECPLSAVSGGKNAVEKAAFRGTAESVELLSGVGFNVANIANNHICQHGAQAFDNTVHALKNNGVEPVGLFSTGEVYYTKPYIENFSGISVGIVGYSLVKERYLHGQTKYANPSRLQILQDIQQLAMEVDQIIVSVHGGVEGVSIPSFELISFFREIIDAGATVVLGHHPHVFQPVEQWGKGLIFYSLGNFIFDLFWDPLLIETAIAEIDIHPNRAPRWKLYPVALQQNYTIRMLKNSKKEEFLKRIIKGGGAVSESNENTYVQQFEKELSRARMQQFAKGRYFLKKFFKGHTSLKGKFIWGKILQLSSRIAIHSRYKG